MLGGKVEECHKFFAVFLQAQRRLWVLWLVDSDEKVESFGRIGFGFWKDLIQGGPEPHGAVHCPAEVCLLTMRGADCQFRRIHSPAFELEKNLAPALRGLAHSVLPLGRLQCNRLRGNEWPGTAFYNGLLRR